MELRQYIRTDMTASAIAHLSVLALIFLFTEVHPFGVVTAEPISVDIAEVFSELRTTSSDDPPDQVAQAQRLEELERVLARLPSRVATALVLHRIQGYSVQEVGDELGVSRETAKKYLARAVEHCRNLRATEGAMKL